MHISEIDIYKWYYYVYLEAREFKRRDKNVSPLTMDSASFLVPFRFHSFLASNATKRERMEETERRNGKTRLHYRLALRDSKSSMLKRNYFLKVVSSGLAGRISARRSLPWWHVTTMISRPPWLIVKSIVNVPRTC